MGCKRRLQRERHERLPRLLPEPEHVGVEPHLISQPGHRHPSFVSTTPCPSGSALPPARCPCRQLDSLRVPRNADFSARTWPLGRGKEELELRLRDERVAALVRPAATVALILLGAGAIGVAAWSLVHGGIGWDSREHTQAALAVRSVDTSWPIARADAAVPGPLEFYGVLIQQLADVLHFVFSGSTARLQPDDPDTYLYQGDRQHDRRGHGRDRSRGGTGNRPPLGPRRRVRLVADPCDAAVARDIPRQLQGRAGRRRPDPRHRRPPAQQLGAVARASDGRRHPPGGAGRRDRALDAAGGDRAARHPDRSEPWRASG